ncbi:hypothetical protein L2E82_21987 [Cichorium intybus]|uniref:Uncharacterized protein n=1 Tax=Cichorium intybus TaxID=13427 RepID=A0ACB9DXP2_CICIN|nr:hypothetical protein L2E82_21987 [Cichorium intybus]
MQRTIIKLLHYLDLRLLCVTKNLSKPDTSLKSAASENSFPVIDEFNNRRKQPDLAEAVAAIRALASVIRSSEANTMMELQNEVKTASDSLKARKIFAMRSQDFIFDGCTILVHGFFRVVLEILKTAGIKLANSQFTQIGTKISPGLLYV